MHPEDASHFGFVDGEMVRVSSRRGTVETKIKISNKQPRGLVFMSFHFPEQANTNLLTNHATDPLAGTAEFKACAVKIEKNEKGSVYSEVQ
ncbi:molybdopterin dinucleotide binding domain-containing protein [Robertmurraya sp. Marseille-Q9965]